MRVEKLLRKRRFAVIIGFFNGIFALFDVSSHSEK